ARAAGPHPVGPPTHPPAPRAAAAEVEAKRDPPGAEKTPHGRRAHRIVHVTAVLRMRVAHHRSAARRTGGPSEPRLEQSRRGADVEWSFEQGQAVRAATCIMKAMSPSMRSRPVMNASWPFNFPSCMATKSASFILRIVRGCAA